MEYESCNMEYERNKATENKTLNIAMVVMLCVIILLTTYSIALTPLKERNDKLLQENAEYLSVIEGYSIKYAQLENEIEDYQNAIKDYKSQLKDYEAQIKEYKAELKTKSNATTTKTNIVNHSSNFGAFKSYTDYKCLSKSSKQWQLQQKAYTDENGLRKIGDAYLVALGSYYGTTLGTEYTVTLSNGSVFDIILCDCKQDRHTDGSNRECLTNSSVLEFYVDSSALPKKVKALGSISAIPYFSGSVVSIVKK